MVYREKIYGYVENNNKGGVHKVWGEGGIVQFLTLWRLTTTIVVVPHR